MMLSTSALTTRGIGRGGDISRTGAHVAGDRGERTQAAATELTRRGTPVRYRPWVSVPGEETCFVVFEAESADAVRDAARLAALPPARVSAAISQS